MTHTTICLIIFVCTIISYILNKIPMALTSLLAMFFMVITGCIDAETALAGFSNTTTIIMVSIFIIAAGLNRTQMVNKVSNLVYKVSGGSFTKGLAGYVLVTALLAQIVPSAILVFSICYPLAADFCKKMGVSPSKAMFSIGLVAISLIATFPIGSGATQYITQNTYLESFGVTEYQFKMFDFMYSKLPMFVLVILYSIFWAPKFAPNNLVGEIEALGKKREEKPPLSPVREVLGYLVFLVVVIALIFADYLPLESWQICMGGALIIVLSGVLTEREAIASMNLPVVLLYIGGLALGNAMAKTGAGELVGNAIASILGKNANGYLVGFVFFFLAFALTQVMVNRSVLNALKPIVVLTCISLGYNPVGPMMLAMFGSSTAFMTPMATAAVPLMMSAGNYSQKDMFKMSWMPAIIICISAVFWTMTIYPV